MKIIACVLLLITGMFTSVLYAAKAKTESVYTGLNAVDCYAEEEWRKGVDKLSHCPGVAGYKLELLEVDSRQSLDVITPTGKSYALNFKQIVSPAFSYLGPLAEWRVTREQTEITPFALIVRVNASENPDNLDQVTPYLIVTKLQSDSICVTDIIPPQPEANEQARQLAASAAERPCKSVKK